MGETHVVGISDANGVCPGSVVGGMAQVFGIIFARVSGGTYCLSPCLVQCYCANRSQTGTLANWISPYWLTQVEAVFNAPQFLGLI
jgi:hypothetical protein